MISLAVRLSDPRFAASILGGSGSHEREFLALGASAAVWPEEVASPSRILGRKRLPLFEAVPQPGTRALQVHEPVRYPLNKRPPRERLRIANLQEHER